MGTSTKITLNEYATTLIRLKARQLIGRYGFKRSDREDIEQDLTLDLLTRLDRFDLGKGRPATFMRLVVDRRAASLVRERKALMRDHCRTNHSLDELSDENGDGTFTEPTLDDRDQQDLAIDMTEALEALPGELRSIAEDLRDGHKLAEIARQRGCSREVMRGKVRHIRKHFAQRGLDEYVAHQSGDATRK